MDEPKQIRRAIRLFYLSAGLQSAYFATGVWLFFWRLYLTNGQIGLLDASCFLAGMIAEVPSGALADRLGRRRTMILGLIIMGVGYGGMGMAVNGWQIWLGFMGVSIGGSFYSGADDALAYDYLKTHDKAELWETVARRKQMIKRLAAIGALFVGGYLGAQDIRWPFYARSFFFFLAILPILAMKFMDRHQPNSNKDVLVTYKRHIWIGMRELLNRRMFPVVLLIIGVQGICATMFIGGILRPLMLERTGLPIADHSAYLGMITIVVTLLLLIPARKNRIAVYYRAVLWSACALFGFALNIPSSLLVVGLIGIFFIHLANAFLLPTVSTLVNQSVSSSHRATALSTSSLLESVPYVLAAPLIGLATDNDMLNLVIYMIILVMVGAISLSLVTYRRNIVAHA